MLQNNQYYAHIQIKKILLALGTAASCLYTSTGYMHKCEEITYNSVHREKLSQYLVFTVKQ